MRDSKTLHYGGTEKENEESEIKRIVAGDLFRTENHVRSEIPPLLLLLCTSVPLWFWNPSPTAGKQNKKVSGTHRYVLTSKGREITIPLLAARQADVLLNQPSRNLLGNA